MRNAAYATAILSLSVCYLSVVPRGSECIRPPRALGRHIRQRRQANSAK